MAIMAPADLLNWLEQMQFLPEPPIAELRGQLASFPTAHVLVKEMILRDWLTPYQANQILQGREDTLVIGPNRVLLKLGEGAMGQVFKAWNTRLGRYVAIKMIHKNLLTSSRVQERFRREMETSSQLEHPNIVRLRDAGDLEGRPYIVMDFFEGDNLSHLVKTRGALSIPKACEFIRQAALGLQHAMDRGVIHRDIKPSNLVLTTTADGKPLVKILDFGLARFATEQSDRRLTQVGNIIGTIDYVSPEQVENAQKADIRSDIYSLGCSLYFLLTARPPFPGNDVVEKIGPRLAGEVPSVRSVRPDIPASLDEVLQKMMGREPRDRYQSPHEVAQALGIFTMQGLIAHDADQTATTLPSVPVARPVAAQAQPVAPAQTRSDVPVARPVPDSSTPSASASAPVARPVAGMPQSATPQTAPQPGSDAGNTAFPQPDDSPLPAPHPHDQRPRQASAAKFPLPPLGVIGFAIVVVLLLIGLAYYMMSGSGPRAAYPNGSLQVMPMEPMNMKEGDRKTLIVTVKRTGFRGPVNIHLEDLPDGVSAQKVVVPENTDRAQLRITASYTIGALKAKARVVATAKELVASESLDVRVRPLRN